MNVNVMNPTGIRTVPTRKKSLKIFVKVINPFFVVEKQESLRKFLDYLNKKNNFHFWKIFLLGAFGFIQLILLMYFLMYFFNVFF